MKKSHVVYAVVLAIILTLVISTVATGAYFDQVITGTVKHTATVNNPGSGWNTIEYNAFYANAVQNDNSRVQGVSSVIFFNADGSSGNWTIDQWHYGASGTAILESPATGNYHARFVAGIYGDVVSKPGAHIGYGAGVLAREIGHGGGTMDVGAGLWVENQRDPNIEKLYGIYVAGGKDGAIYVKSGTSYFREVEATNLKVNGINILALIIELENRIAALEAGDEQ